MVGIGVLLATRAVAGPESPVSGTVWAPKTAQVLDENPTPPAEHGVPSGEQEDDSGRRRYARINLLFAVPAAVFVWTGEVTLFSFGLSTMYLGPPINHWAHGETAAGFISLGIGLGIGAASGAAGYRKLCSEGNCAGEQGGYALVGTLVGMGLGGLVFLLFDTMALEWDLYPTAGHKPKREDSQFSLFPQVWAWDDSIWFGVIGHF